ncbi:hypothetical protein E2C01_031426 [Portunus trituberculatus]|uniref:Uncharacterized protein n=1 Tax=Portunus trituberculatus TaxID=210409 RepID=A0A5B7EST0_PORTR|nr:hypothetical protein [Portunus trituberculatus]
MLRLQCSEFFSKPPRTRVSSSWCGSDARCSARCCQSTASWPPGNTNSIIVLSTSTPRSHSVLTYLTRQLPSLTQPCHAPSPLTPPHLLCCWYLNTSINIRPSICVHARALRIHGRLSAPRNFGHKEATRHLSAAHLHFYAFSRIPFHPFITTDFFGPFALSLPPSLPSSFSPFIPPRPHPGHPLLPGTCWAPPMTPPNKITSGAPFPHRDTDHNTRGSHHQLLPSLPSRRLPRAYLHKELHPIS